MYNRVHQEKLQLEYILIQQIFDDDNNHNLINQTGKLNFINSLFYNL